MPVTPITSFDEFQKIISGDKTIIIDFWATWCGPCRTISPIFEQLSNLAEYENIGFYKVDVDDQDQISQEVGIRAMPTFITFKNGNKGESVVGAIPTALKDLVEKALI